MSGAETARRLVVQRRIGGAESAAPKRRRRNSPPPRKGGGGIEEWVGSLLAMLMLLPIQKHKTKTHDYVKKFSTKYLNFLLHHIIRLRAF